MNELRMLGIILVAAVTATAVLVFETLATHRSEPVMAGELPSLAGATQWLNTAPLDFSGLRGRVVLVEFWTYSCLNWRRAFPHTRAWAQAYKDHGLVVIGVHSPEFEFEKDPARVRRELVDRRIDYPVAMDNRHAIWRAFGNHYWPAVYVIDARGRVRYRHFGEGEYARTESVLRQLLAEAGSDPGHRPRATVWAHGVEAAPDWKNLRTPEIYLGSARGGNLVRMSGEWMVLGEYALAAQASARMSLRFHARDAHLVMGSANVRPVRFRVRLDGKDPGEDRGLDVDAQGYGTVREPRIYQLVRQRGRIGEKRLEVEFLEAGVEAYTFTFG